MPTQNMRNEYSDRVDKENEKLTKSYDEAEKERKELETPEYLKMMNINKSETRIPLYLNKTIV